MLIFGKDNLKRFGVKPIQKNPPTFGCNSDPYRWENIYIYIYIYIYKYIYIQWHTHKYY